jgi:hypothetical protein
MKAHKKIMKYRRRCFDTEDNTDVFCRNDVPRASLERPGEETTEREAEGVRE